MKNTNYFKSGISLSGKLFHGITDHAKIIYLAIIFLLMKPVIYAQVGNWDVVGGDVKTSTYSLVGINTNDPKGLLEILNTDIHYKSLIVTHSASTQTGTGTGGQSTIINPGILNRSGSQNTNIPLLSTKKYDYNLEPSFLIRNKMSIYANPGPSGDQPAFPTPIGSYYENLLMFKSGCLGINSNNPRAELDVTHIYDNNASTKLNYPVAIFGSMHQLPQVASTAGEGEGDNISNNEISYTRHIQFVNYLSDNGFSKISTNGDQGIFWTDGAGTATLDDGQAISGTNTNSGLVIAPWNHSLSGMRISNEGNVSIGTADNFGYKLAVNGEIGCKKIHVEVTNPWPDYVFCQEYKLCNLADLEKFIKVNKHLPDLPSSTEVAQNGIELSEMNVLFVKKIEELTLYIIEQNKRIEKLEKLVK